MTKPQEDNERNPIFDVIQNRTKFCANCGHPFDMKSSGHRHLPFCEKCRAKIILLELGTIESTDIFIPKAIRRLFRGQPKKRRTHN